MTKALCPCMLCLGVASPASHSWRPSKALGERRRESDSSSHSCVKFAMQALSRTRPVALCNKYFHFLYSNVHFPTWWWFRWCSHLLWGLRMCSLDDSLAVVSSQFVEWVSKDQKQPGKCMIQIQQGCVAPALWQSWKETSFNTPGSLQQLFSGTHQGGHQGWGLVRGQQPPRLVGSSLAKVVNLCIHWIPTQDQVLTMPTAGWDRE